MHTWVNWLCSLCTICACCAILHATPFFFFFYSAAATAITVMVTVTRPVHIHTILGWLRHMRRKHLGTDTCYKSDEKTCACMFWQYTDFFLQIINIQSFIYLAPGVQHPCTYNKQESTTVIAFTGLMKELVRRCTKFQINGDEVVTFYSQRAKVSWQHNILQKHLFCLFFNTVF